MVAGAPTPALQSLAPILSPRPPLVGEGETSWGENGQHHAAVHLRPPPIQEDGQSSQISSGGATRGGSSFGSSQVSSMRNQADVGDNGLQTSPMRMGSISHLLSAPAHSPSSAGRPLPPPPANFRIPDNITLGLDIGEDGKERVVGQFAFNDPHTAGTRAHAASKATGAGEGQEAGAPERARQEDRNAMPLVGHGVNGDASRGAGVEGRGEGRSRSRPSEISVRLLPLASSTHTLHS